MCSAEKTKHRLDLYVTINTNINNVWHLTARELPNLTLFLSSVRVRTSPLALLLSKKTERVARKKRFKEKAPVCFLFFLSFTESINKPGSSRASLSHLVLNEREVGGREGGPAAAPSRWRTKRESIVVRGPRLMTQRSLEFRSDASRVAPTFRIKY